MSYNINDFGSDVQSIVNAVRQAGREIMPLWRSQDLKSAIKADGSVVTEADYRSNNVLLGAIRALDSQTPILSEETHEEFIAEHGSMPADCWIIDPLDGTSVFKLGQEAFKIFVSKNINFKPVLSAAHNPVHNKTYFAIKDGGAYLLDKHGEIRKLWRDPITDDNFQLRQRSLPIYDDDIVKKIGQEFAHVSGFSKPVKQTETLCMPHFQLAVADGTSDITIHYLNAAYRAQNAGAGVWDNSPVDLILREANCNFVNDRAEPFVYNDLRHSSQMSLTLAPGLDAKLLSETVHRVLTAHNLPKPRN